MGKGSARRWGRSISQEEWDRIFPDEVKKAEIEVADGVRFNPGLGGQHPLVKEQRAEQADD